MSEPVVNLKAYNTSVDTRPGFNGETTLTITQTVTVESRAAAEKLAAEYPDAAMWSDGQTKAQTKQGATA